MVPLKAYRLWRKKNGLLYNDIYSTEEGEGWVLTFFLEFGNLSENSSIL